MKIINIVNKILKYICSQSFQVSMFPTMTFYVALQILMDHINWTFSVNVLNIIVSIKLK